MRFKSLPLFAFMALLFVAQTMVAQKTMKSFVDQLMKTLVKYKAEKEIPLVVGGIIPESDFPRLKEMGAQHIFTPKDYDLVGIMEKNLEIAEKFA